MNVTIEQAIEIYAKAMMSWHPMAAARLAQQRADELAKRDDLEGVWIWEMVKLAIEQMDRSLPVTVGASNSTFRSRPARRNH
jgi:hypothetical protein